MKLNVKKIKQLKKKSGLTYQDIAKLGGLKSRQHVYDYILNARLSGADFFGKIFKIPPKDLIL